MAYSKARTFQGDTGLSVLLADIDVKGTVNAAVKVDEAVASAKKKAYDALGLAPEIGWSMLHASAVADAAKDVTKAYTKAKKAGAKAEKDTLKIETIANLAAEKGEMTIYSKTFPLLRRVVNAAYKVEESTKIIETLQQKLAAATAVSKMRRREKTRSAAALRRSLACSSKVELSSVEVDSSDDKSESSDDESECSSFEMDAISCDEDDITRLDSVVLLQRLVAPLAVLCPVPKERKL